MEFFAGIFTTLFFQFIGYKIYKSRQRSKARKAYVPPQATPRPGPQDYPTEPEKHKP